MSTKAMSLPLMTASSDKFRLLRKSYNTGCTVSVMHTNETLEAHVELDNNLQPETGDKITVHGAPVQIEFGETIHLRRDATLVRASVFDKLWVRFKSMFLLTELYEVSFSTAHMNTRPSGRII